MQSFRRVAFALLAVVVAAWLSQAELIAQSQETELPTIVVESKRKPQIVTKRKRESQRAAVRVPQSADTVPDADPQPALPEGVVLDGGPPATITTAGPVSGYRALTAVSATKTNTPIERIPQSIQVVPRSVIDDQQPVTQSETIRNVSATTGMPSNILYGWNYKVRGFDAERYVDGLPNYNDAGDYTSMANTERIEVVKGPGGVFFQSGIGIIGGVINTISKLPHPVRGYQAGIVAGGFNLWNPWLDLNQPLDATGSALFRLTTEFAQSQDFIDVIERQRYSFNPSLTFTNHDTTTLTLQGRLSHRDQQVYTGLPAVGTLDRSLLTVRRDLFVGPPDIPKAESDAGSLTLRLDHAFDSVWSTNVTARYSEFRVREPAQFFFFNRPDFGTAFGMWNFSVPDRGHEITVNPNLIARFHLAGIDNTLLLGADYDRVSASVTSTGAFAGLVDFANPFPVFPPYVDPSASGFVFFDAANINVNSGFTVQLQSTIAERLHLLTGARLAHVDILGSNPFSGTDFHTTESKLLPRAGAAYDVVRGVTLFAGYSEGLRGVRFFAGQGAPKPEEAAQKEGGVKLALPFGFSATLALFEITRRNVVSIHPLNPLLQIQTGEQRSRGFDADVIWQPLPGLSLLGSYAHIDAEITQDALLPVGNRLERVPMDSGRLWVNYRVQDGWLKNLSIGAGLYAASPQALALDNQFFTPGYITLDARVGYETGPWTMALVGKNLTDERYFVPYPYANGRVAPGDPLTVFAVASVKY